MATDACCERGHYHHRHDECRLPRAGTGNNEHEKSGHAGKEGRDDGHQVRPVVFVPRRGKPYEDQHGKDHGTEHGDDHGGLNRDGSKVEQRPDACADENRRDEKAPATHARDDGGRDQNDCQIAEQRPGVGRLAGHQSRRRQRAEKADAGERLSVNERRDYGCDRDNSQQEESACRTEEAIDGMGGKHRAEQGECAGGGEDSRYVCSGSTGHRHLPAPAAHEFARRDEQHAEQGCHGEAHAGTEYAGLDGVAHQKQPAERQRDTADPDGPARAERGFYVASGLFWNWRRSDVLSLCIRRYGCLYPRSIGVFDGIVRFGRNCLPCFNRLFHRKRFGRLRNGGRAGCLHDGNDRPGTFLIRLTQCNEVRLDAVQPLLLSRGDHEENDDGNDCKLVHERPLVR